MDFGNTMDSRIFPDDLFGATFLGEYVEIILKAEPRDEGKLLVRGYLLDMDDDYYFLGAGPLEISGCVKKDLVGIINITEEIDPALEALQNSPDPVTDEDIN